MIKDFDQNKLPYGLDINAVPTGKGNTTIHDLNLAISKLKEAHELLSSSLPAKDENAETFLKRLERVIIFCIKHQFETNKNRRRNDDSQKIETTS